MHFAHLAAFLIATSLCLFADISLARPQPPQGDRLQDPAPSRVPARRMNSAEVAAADPGPAMVSEVLRPHLDVEILRPRTTLIYRHYVPGGAGDPFQNGPEGPAPATRPRR